VGPESGGGLYTPSAAHRSQDLYDNIDPDRSVLAKSTFRGQFPLIDSSYGNLGRNVLNNLSVLLDGPNQAWAEHRQSGSRRATGWRCPTARLVRPAATTRRVVDQTKNPQAETPTSGGIKAGTRRAALI